MPSVLTKKYRTFLAKQFLEQLTAENIAAYVFLGRPQQWSDPDDETVSDVNPPTPVDTPQSVDFEFWRDIIGMKRVGAANTNFVVRRVDWTAGTVYAQYDDTDASLYSKDFYVLDTSDSPNRVYKCLWNNNGGASNVSPLSIGTAVNPVATLDGYVWQYMYTIDEVNDKFLTENWMPVLTDDDVISNANTFAGRLPTAVPLVVESGGASYNASVSVAVTISGDGADANVTSNGVTIVAGAINSVILAAGGSGYTQVDSISVSQNGVSNSAVVRAIIPPYPNHGYDPIKELGASALMLTITFNEDEGGDLTVVNNFRRAGLIINPVEAAGNVASNTFYRQTYDITFTANTGVLAADDVVVNTSNDNEPTGIVVDVLELAANTYQVRLTGVNPRGETTPFANDDVLKCAESGVEVTVANVAEPLLQKYSGSIVYVNQRTPVTRGETQDEEIKLVFPIG